MALQIEPFQRNLFRNSDRDSTSHDRHPESHTIRNRAARFAKDFAAVTYESGFDQKFVNQLCWVFGISDWRLIDFQTRVKKLGDKAGRIDAFLPGKLLVEMKSCNKGYSQLL